MSLNLSFRDPYEVPHHSLIFENDSNIPITIWLLFDGVWDVLPTLGPGECLMPIPLTKGMRLQWKGISSATIATYNQSHEANFTHVQESVLYCASLVHWTGKISCKLGLLGRSTRVTMH
jgi:hypothetical protein